MTSVAMLVQIPAAAASKALMEINTFIHARLDAESIYWILRRESA